MDLVVVPVGIAVLGSSIVWALQLPPRLLGCADHATDGGLTCFYGDVTGRRIATTGVGLAAAILICGLTFAARRDTKR
jgi:hypothetical protein